MADEAEKKDEAGAEEGAEKKKLPLWVIILIASQVVLVVVAVVVFKMMSGGAAKEEHEDVVAEETAAPAHDAGKAGGHGEAAGGHGGGGEHGKAAEKVSDSKAMAGPQKKLDAFIVNLIDDGRGPRYLKVEMSFELEDASVESEIDSRISQIRDELLILLSSKRQTDIETTDGKRILKDEIFTRVNKVLATGRIKRIFFNEFVIQ